MTNMNSSAAHLDGVPKLLTPTTLLTPDQVSTWLGIPQATLGNWRSLRKGPVFLRMGVHVRYRLVDVEDWLTERAAAGREWMAS